MIGEDEFMMSSSEGLGQKASSASLAGEAAGGGSQPGSPFREEQEEALGGVN